MTHGRFIGVEVAPHVAADPALAAALTEVCPVDIFGQRADGTLSIVDANLDECVLCGLCEHAAPAGTVVIVKRYEEAV
jgi:NAD-dependent dihydropyrimidine dehydrogenase PreA subunit